MPSNNIISQTYHPFLSNIEIDTIRMCKKRWEITDIQLEFIISKFRARKVSSFRWIGKFKGFELEINDYALTIIGSPSNYYMGKTKTLPYSKFRLAIEKLGVELDLNLHNSRLYRVDINWNCITELPIESYTQNLFLDLSRFKRIERDLGVLFFTKSKAIDIYNKTMFLEDKKIESNIENWLRIEFRVLKDVKKILGISYVEDLYNPSNYKNLLSEFNMHYQNIKKQIVANNDISALISLKEYRKLQVLRGIEQNGGLTNSYREIDQLSKMKVITCPNKKYRFRKELRTLAENPIISKTHPLIKELNKQFSLDIKLEIEKIG